MLSNLVDWLSSINQDKVKVSPFDEKDDTEERSPSKYRLKPGFFDSNIEPVVRNLWPSDDLTIEEGTPTATENLMREKLKKFESTEKIYTAIEKIMLFFGVAMTAYLAYQNPISPKDNTSTLVDSLSPTSFPTSFPTSISTDILVPSVTHKNVLSWELAVAVTQNALPLLMTFIVRNVLIFTRSRAMNDILTKYASAAKQRHAYKDYEEAMKNAIKNMCTGMKISVTPALEETLITAFTYQFLTNKEDRENLDKFKKGLQIDFSLDELKFNRWRFFYAMIISLALATVIGMSILFCGLIKFSPALEKIGQFVVAILLGLITVLSTLLKNDTLFPLKRSSDQLEENIAIIIKMEKSMSTLMEMLNDQLEAERILTPKLSLSSTAASDAAIPALINKQELRQIYLFFPSMVHQEAKELILSKYNNLRDEAAESFDNLKREMQSNGQQLTKLKLGISDEVSFIINFSNDFEITTNLNPIKNALDAILAIDTSGTQSRRGLITVHATLRNFIETYLTPLQACQSVYNTPRASGLVSLK